MLDNSANGFCSKRLRARRTRDGYLPGNRVHYLLGGSCHPYPSLTQSIILEVTSTSSVWRFVYDLVTKLSSYNSILMSFISYSKLPSPDYHLSRSTSLKDPDDSPKQQRLISPDSWSSLPFRIGNLRPGLHLGERNIFWYLLERRTCELLYLLMPQSFPTDSLIPGC